MKRQQEKAYQLDLFAEQMKNAFCLSETCKDVNQAKAGQEEQINKERQQGRALTDDLMTIICSSENLKQAYKRVKRNKGVAGIDQMPTGKFAEWFIDNGELLIKDLLQGKYQPQAVKQVEIPKRQGGKRKLGIPTVTDRIIQQAISQVLSPIYERGFSEFSYGFRPKRKAQMALKQASEYVSEGRAIVVDMDMKSFFDEVNHDRLMYQMSTKIADKTLLKLIRKYLRSGILSGGLISQRLKGTPQGSPLSPLLFNIVLDELDKELEKRGHCFVRYADDFSIYVRSQKAGERVKKSISSFIINKLKLKVNEQKSIVCEVNKTVLLGHTISKDGNLIIAKENVERFKTSIRKIIKRNRGVSFEQIISELNSKLRGWFEYFKHTKSKGLFRELDAWIRRKLRCFRIKQTKRTIGLVRFLKKQGVETYQSWIIALSGRGWWRKSAAPQIHQAMNNLWFREQKLFNLSLNYEKLNY
ncbi:MAG: group II intron reverse transcriptase/maturase [Bacteroidales bacterium]|nr:group II intron reverse transcriptase/maturase [Bacteroidales bacterium]